MEFFGVTQNGVSNPIKDIMREDYKEPHAPVIKDKTKEIDYGEELRELDCYIGHADGYAYKSNERLRYMRKKHVIKPEGPCRMYKYPGTDAMKYGWWSESPEMLELLNKSDWYKQKEKYPKIFSEKTKIFESCLKVDKYFKM